MQKKLPYLIIGLLAMLLRFYLNFHTQLVPGLNGGYYLVQVRSLLNNGALAFPDMPLLFYLQGLLVKIIAWLMPALQSDQIIIFVAKFTDSIGLPLMLIPIYLIIRDFLKDKLSRTYELTMIGFLVLSGSPLMLTSDLQKNALAMPIMLFFIYYFLLFLRNKNKKQLLLTILFLVLTGITHFGVFSVSFGFFILGLIIFYHKKALLPVIITGVLGVALVALFDISRAERLLVFWWNDKDFRISTRLLMDPIAVVNYLLSLLILGLSLFTLRRRMKEMDSFTKKTIVLLLALLLMMLYPFLRFEFWRRLGMMQFVPQVLLLLFLFPSLSGKLRITLTSIAVMLISGSLFMHVTRPKPPGIIDAAWADLKKIETVIEKDKNMIIVTRHGLDWWVAWTLETRIAVAYHNVLDSEFRSIYDPVYIIKQKKGRNRDYPGKTSPFTEPPIPPGSRLVYSSDYFELYQLSN